MSLNLYLECPCCNNSNDDFNVTYNLSQMWHATGAEGDRMIKIEGMTGEQSLPILEKAFKELESNPQKYLQYEPKNGWGTYVGLVEFIERLIIAAKERPNQIWRAFR